MRNYLQMRNSRNYFAIPMRMFANSIGWVSIASCSVAQSCISHPSLQALSAKTSNYGVNGPTVQRMNERGMEALPELATGGGL
ncbi:MAG: hypothetical protein ACHQ1H_13195 [Nitrososphaerales archaeon]